MRISRLYSNQSAFRPIDFWQGLNVVLAEIRLPENQKKSTHNLGKTTLGRLLDYCLLAKADDKTFLIKNREVFKEFVFFLEVALLDGSFVTIRRGVSEATKISFKRHPKPGQDFSWLPKDGWDHVGVAFDRAKELLDGLADFRAVRPWDFRNALGYQIRTQEDYKDVFHLPKFSGKHSEWKPFVAHLLGLNGRLVEERYETVDRLKHKQGILNEIAKEGGGALEDDESATEGLLLIRHREAERRQALLDALDFRQPDKDRTKQLVDDIDARIAQLNNERYYLSHSRRRIQASLKEGTLLFDLGQAEQLFSEAEVLFPGQLRKDFEQLVAFNRAVTEERSGYLQEELKDVETNLRRVTSELNELGRRRLNALAFIGNTDVFSKYRELSADLVDLKADIAVMERRREQQKRVRELRREIRSLEDEDRILLDRIREDVVVQSSNPESRFSQILLYFNEIVQDVLNQSALLTVRVNKEGNLEFGAEIVNNLGRATDEAKGHSYRKLLCMAFDMAVARAYLDEKFPRFLYHDGAFESLDDRKKAALLAVLRRYSDLGIQQIVTLIDSDMPPPAVAGEATFSSEEIAVVLHDEGEEGRLFRMATW